MVNKAKYERYDVLIQEFMENGFTKEQAAFLIRLLNDFVPLVG